ncbi:MAG: phosphotransferase family protein [Sphingobium sp.]
MTTTTSGETVSPHVRDLDELKGAMTDWLGARMPEVTDIRLDNFTYPRGAGMSHETILFDAHWTEGGTAREQGLVVRIKPTGHLVYQDDMFEQQYRIMSALYEDGRVRVAKTLWLEHDPSLLGAPFFVMEKRAGNVAVSIPPYSREGWLFDSSPEMRHTVWRNAVTQLGLIQTVPLDKVAFLDPPGGPNGFDFEWDRWNRFLGWISQTERFEFLERALAALEKTMPPERPAGIVWGDSRLGNMMIAKDGSVAAVMDWEQISLGGPLHDLGWWLQIDEGQTKAQGIPRLEGMGTREETIALWTEVSGKSAADIDWFQAFAAFKLCCLTVQTCRLGAAIARGRDPVDNPTSRALAAMLDIAPPRAA